MRWTFVLLLSVVSLAPHALAKAGPRATAGAWQTFTGIIIDAMCGEDGGSHAHMRMGPTDAECTKACVDAHGASYVLYDGTRALALSDQRAPARFAGQTVTIVGTLDAKRSTIQVESIAAKK